MNWRAICCLKVDGLVQSHVTQGVRAPKDAWVMRLVKRIVEVLKYVAVEIYVIRCLWRGRDVGNCTGLCSWYQKNKELEFEVAGEPERSSTCVLSWVKNSSLQLKNLW